MNYGVYVTFPTMSRRTFLQIAAHLVLLCMNQVILPSLVACAIQPTLTAGRYGSGAYGRDPYPGANGKMYLPVISIRLTHGERITNQKQLPVRCCSQVAA